jgi:hypothetical protein
MVTKKPIAGSLIKANLVREGQRYDLWAIVVEFDEKDGKMPNHVETSVVEIVPEDYDVWTAKCIEPDRAGSKSTVPIEKIEMVIHPRRRMTRNAEPQFVVKLNNGRISDIYAVGTTTAAMRMVDLARHYGNGEKRQDFHRDVLVTRKGIEEIEPDSWMG